jgi:hypothetical protein
VCIYKLRKTGFIFSGVFSFKVETETSVSTKDEQFLDQLTYYDVYQEEFSAACCFTISIFSTSCGLVHILCGLWDRFPLSFIHIQRNSSKRLKSMFNISVMTPIKISPGTETMADQSIEPITRGSLACSMLTHLIS